MRCAAQIINAHGVMFEKSMAESVARNVDASVGAPVALLASDGIDITWLDGTVSITDWSVGFGVVDGFLMARVKVELTLQAKICRVSMLRISLQNNLIWFLQKRLLTPMI